MLGVQSKVGRQGERKLRGGSTGPGPALGLGGEGRPQLVRMRLHGWAVCPVPCSLPAERRMMWGPRFSAHRTEAFPPNPRHSPRTSTALSGLWTCPEGCRGPSPDHLAGRLPEPDGAPRREAGGQEAQESPRDPRGGGWTDTQWGTQDSPGWGAGWVTVEGGRRAAGKESR